MMPYLSDNNLESPHMLGRAATEENTRARFTSRSFKVKLFLEKTVNNVIDVNHFIFWNEAMLYGQGPQDRDLTIFTRSKDKMVDLTPRGLGYG